MHAITMLSAPNKAFWSYLPLASSQFAIAVLDGELIEVSVKFACLELQEVCPLLLRNLLDGSILEFPLDFHHPAPKVTQSICLCLETLLF